ncbi:MAG TPA: DUF3667 domain-containing protein [Woeseiaceae bacterium]|nr:DUF3667 domain-containing protein [Woeseiaceae bacterium]
MYYCGMPVCSNCQSSLDGEYCSTCGQRNLDLEKPIWSLVGAVISETFEVDGRAASTVRTLFRHPGMLTGEFLAGRRVAYSPPLRLYLVFSIVFFLLIAWFAPSGILREPGSDLNFDAAVLALEFPCLDGQGSAEFRGLLEGLRAAYTVSDTVKCPTCAHKVCLVPVNLPRLQMLAFITSHCYE